MQELEGSLAQAAQDKGQLTAKLAQQVGCYKARRSDPPSLLTRTVCSWQPACWAFCAVPKVVEVSEAGDLLPGHRPHAAVLMLPGPQCN